MGIQMLTIYYVAIKDSESHSQVLMYIPFADIII